MEFVSIEVHRREAKGSSAVRRLRRAGEVPGVLYGLGRPNLDLRIADRELDRFLKSGSRLVELRMGDKARPAIVRDIQIDPVEDTILHCDFTRVSDDIAIDDRCRIVFKGRAKGTLTGGVFQGLLDVIEVRAKPRDLPREIVIDISEMELGDSVHVSDLEFADSVEVVSRPDELVCQVTTPKATADDTDDEDEAEEGAEGAAEGAPADG